MKPQSFNYFFVCDSVVITPAGQVEIKNIFNWLATPNLPIQRDIIFCAGFLVDREYNEVGFHIKDEEGRTLYTFLQPYEKLLAGRTNTIAGKMPSVIFEKYGSYYIHLSINGNMLPDDNRYKMEVVMPEAQPEGKMTNDSFAKLFAKHFNKDA